MLPKCSLVLLTILILEIVHGKIIPIVKEEYIIANSFLDSSLQELETKLIKEKDISVHFHNVTLSKYTLHNVRLADLTSIKRVGDCLLWNKGQTMYVVGHLNLSTMFLVGETITGPSHQVGKNPLVTSGNNDISFSFTVWMDHEAFCNVKYDMAWTDISGATLYSDSPSLDSLQVADNLNDINAQLTPNLKKIFEAHMNMCERKRLQQLELLKWSLQPDVYTILMNRNNRGK